MGRLFKYEMRKVLSKRSFIIVLLIMMLIIVSNELTPVILGNYKPKKEMETALSGTVIGDEYLSTLKDDNEHGTTNPIEFFIKSATGQVNLEGWTEDKLYSTRKEINNSMMREGGISAEEIKIWEKWDEANTEPFTYYYSGLYTSIFEFSGYMNFILLIATAVGLSGLFAEERPTNMDQMIFCSKLGRTRLFGIKTLVGFTVGLMIAGLMIVTSLITDVILYGTGGAQMMLQILLPMCLRPMTMGRAVAVMIGFFIAEEMAFVVIIMFVSQLTMNRAVTISAMFLIMFMSMINLPSSLGVLFIIWNCIPGATVGSWLFDNYHLIRIFGLNITNLVYTPVIWVIAGTIVVLVTRNIYVKYQIKSR